jgi:hypothetical protein
MVASLAVGSSRSYRLPPCLLNSVPNRFFPLYSLVAIGTVRLCLLGERTRLLIVCRSRRKRYTRGARLKDR